MPRVQCERHKVKQVAAPWSESKSRFTALFEALVIHWLREANTAAVAQQMGLSWDEVDGIMQRAVQRGLERREVQAPQRIGVDETSFQELPTRAVRDSLKTRSPVILELCSIVAAGDLEAPGEGGQHHRTRQRIISQEGQVHQPRADRPCQAPPLDRER